MLVSNSMATLHELDTVYSVEDSYVMLDILSVDRHNKRVSDEIARQMMAENKP